MKKIVFISVVLLCIPYLSFAQEKSPLKSRIYNTWIEPARYGTKDILYQVKDSSLIVADSFDWDYSKDKGKVTLKEIGYRNIEIIKIRSKRAIITGTVSCTIIGGFLGAGIGYMSGDDSHNYIFWLTAEQKSLIGGIIGGLSGAAIGALIGSIRITIPINRNIVNFNNNKERLRKYSYSH
jgi:hypothetical protein